jgi:large subunit ribosomal protein L10
MSKAIKRLMIDVIRTELGGARDLLVLNTAKLDPVRDNSLRSGLRKKGIKILQVKNTLARVALAENGVTGLDSLLAGPTVLVWGGEDVVALSREIVKIAGESKDLIVVRGGAVDGQPLNAAGVTDLSKSMGRPELLSKIAGLILAPGARLAGALLGAGGVVAGQIKSIADKEGEPAA